MSRNIEHERHLPNSTQNAIHTASAEILYRVYFSIAIWSKYVAVLVTTQSSIGYFTNLYRSEWQPI